MEATLLNEAAARVDLEHSSFGMDYRKLQYPVTVLLPYIPGGFSGAVVASLLYYAKHIDCGFELQGHTLIESARNILADRFLASEAHWSFWLDSDVFMPFAHADTFLFYSQAQRLPRHFAEYNTIGRLLAHKQPLVGGVYAARNKRGPIIIQPELAPRHASDQRVAQALREGKSAGGLYPVDWLAAGLMLVHRMVFEKIKEAQPVQREGPYPFFDRFNGLGEDQSFCQRARAAGFQPMLDTEIRAGHIGLAVFLPEDSAPPVRIGGATERRAHDPRADT